MLPFGSHNNYNKMLSQEDSNKDNSSENLPPLKGEPIKPRAPSKAVRLLTVIAYVLSVSLAAIFLSIYYIFIWKDKTLVSAHTFNSTPSLLCNYSILEAEELENASFLRGGPGLGNITVPG